MSDIKKYIVNGYYPTIGIECHVQLKTKTKLFASVSNEAREAAQNTLVSHICFGLPGALPVLNEKAVTLAAKAAFALGTEPQTYSKFDRKHYFYPDLPKGYQISQFEEPIILGGEITIYLENGDRKVINITRAHMEEDAGKSTHPAGRDYSLVDLNRAGTPLLEIVSEPEIHSAEEAKAYAKELWLRMKYAGVSDVDLYHGNMRFDVNVSVSKDPSKLGIRSETKNLNSFRSVERAVEYEIKRQIELLESGGEVVQETRGWLDDFQKTVSQRTKENAHDYRYFPDPDLPPIILSKEYVETIRSSMGALPQEWRESLEEKGLATQTIEELLLAEVEFDELHFLDVFTAIDDEKRAKNFANWVLNIFVPRQRDKADIVCDVERMKSIEAAVYALLSGGKLSSNAAKELLEILATEEKLPTDIEQFAEEKGLIQMNDSGELEKIVDEVIESNPKPVEDVRNGEMKAIGFLVGQVMQKSQGKANPAEAKKLLQSKLS